MDSQNPRLPTNKHNPWVRRRSLFKVAFSEKIYGKESDCVQWFWWSKFKIEEETWTQQQCCEVKMKINIFLKLLFVLFFSNSVLALKTSDLEKDLSIQKGIEIEVLGFNHSLKMIRIQSVKFPGEGDSWVKAKALHLAVKKDKRIILDLSDQIIGKRYLLLTELETYVIKDDSLREIQSKPNKKRK